MTHITGMLMLTGMERGLVIWVLQDNRIRDGGIAVESLSLVHSVRLLLKRDSYCKDRLYDLFRLTERLYVYSARRNQNCTSFLIKYVNKMRLVP